MHLALLLLSLLWAASADAVTCVGPGCGSGGTGGVIETVDPTRTLDWMNSTTINIDGVEGCTSPTHTESNVFAQMRPVEECDIDAPGVRAATYVPSSLVSRELINVGVTLAASNSNMECQVFVRYKLPGQARAETAPTLLQADGEGSPAGKQVVVPINLTLPAGAWYSFVFEPATLGGGSPTCTWWIGNQSLVYVDTHP